MHYTITSNIKKKKPYIQFYKLKLIKSCNPEQKCTTYYETKATLSRSFSNLDLKELSVSVCFAVFRMFIEAECLVLVLLMQIRSEPEGRYNNNRSVSYFGAKTFSGL